MESPNVGKNDPCPCGSGKKHRQCCWLTRFERIDRPVAVAPPPRAKPQPAPVPPGLYAACPCVSGKTYRRCCYPRVFPDPSKPNFGIEPHLELAATRRAHKRRAALPPQHGLTISTVDVGRTRLDCAPLPPVGDALPGTLAPPTPRQIEAKYDLIRESNPDGVTEVVVDYTYPEEFGAADARMVFDADDYFTLDDGRIVSVLDLQSGVRVRMGDGGIGTLTANPEFRYDHPIPPLPGDGGLWSSRVVGSVRHTAYEILDVRVGGFKIEGTPGHPVWSMDRQWWVRACELEPGELVRVDENVVAPVEQVGPLRTGLIEVFGIEVEYFHNYFIGQHPNAMLVHNGPECVGKPVIADALESGAINRTSKVKAGVAKPPDHHIFPQELREEFARRGFTDIDNYLVRLDKGVHEAIHYKLPTDTLRGGFWNNEFLRRMAQREADMGQLPRREILLIGAQMRRQYIPNTKLLAIGG